jgi:hypothetical protein
MCSRLFFVLIASLAISFANAQVFIEPTAPGRITGSVLSEDGQSMDRARVCVTIKRVSPRGALRDCTLLTDHLGKFEIDHIKNGTYALSAAKPEDGYAIIDEPGQQVTMSNADPLHVITIKLGPRGGVLTCLVTDKLTGKPIEPEKPTWTERVNFAGGGPGSVPMKGNFQATLPAATDVTITATARGYKDWSYRDPSNPTLSALRLASGERGVLKIEMEPVSKDGT